MTATAQTSAPTPSMIPFRYTAGKTKGMFTTNYEKNIRMELIMFNLVAFNFSHLSVLRQKYYCNNLLLSVLSYQS